MTVDCDFCERPVATPIRDPEAVSWLGDGAATFCSTDCLDAYDEHRINAAGGDRS